MRPLFTHCQLVLGLLLAACSGAGTVPTPTVVVPTTSPAPSPLPPTRTLPPPTPTHQPSLDPSRVLAPGAWHATVYHAGLRQVVLVNGGPESGQGPNEPLELWSWDGQRWSLISADGPPWRNFASVAYDVRRDVLVVYGGLQSRTRRFHELWEWDGAHWTQHASDGPGPREAAAMAYDAARGQLVLFGGAVNTELAGDTWSWDGQTWTQLAATGPAARFPGAMAYDPLSEQVLLYGGHVPTASGDAVDRADLWAWDGTAWRELAQGAVTPGVRSAAALTYDPLSGAMLLYGGGFEATFYADTWLWDGARWLEQAASAPGPRTFHGLAYDEARQRLVLSGGHDRPMGPPLTDTWEWDGARWTCAENCPPT